MTALTRTSGRLPAIICLFCCTLTARPLERVQTWDKLSAEITGEAISMVLPDGTSLHGIGRGIEADELILDVRQSSNSRSHPKGRARIPRAEVSVIDIYLRHQSGGSRGAAIGAGVGVVALSPAAVYLGDSDHQGVGAVALVAGAAAGWYIGHHFFDRDRADASHVRITVAPPPTQAR